MVETVPWLMFCTQSKVSLRTESSPELKQLIHLLKELNLGNQFLSGYMTIKTQQYRPFNQSNDRDHPNIYTIVFQSYTNYSKLKF